MFKGLRNYVLNLFRDSLDREIEKHIREKLRKDCTIIYASQVKIGYMKPEFWDAVDNPTIQFNNRIEKIEGELIGWKARGKFYTLANQGDEYYQGIVKIVHDTAENTAEIERDTGVWKPITSHLSERYQDVS